MLKYLKSIFARKLPTVSGVVADIQAKVHQLNALVTHHGDKSYEHATAAAVHGAEADKAAKISGKLGELIS